MSGHAIPVEGRYRPSVRGSGLRRTCRAALMGAVGVWAGCGLAIDGMAPGTGIERGRGGQPLVSLASPAFAQTGTESSQNGGGTVVAEGGQPDPAGAMAIPSSVVALDPPAETLGARVYQGLLDQGDGNVVLSPASMEIAVSMIGEATRAPLRESIREAVGVPYESLAAINDLPPSEKATVTFANALWLAPGYTLTPDYSHQMQSVFGGEVFSIDFATGEPSKTINDWVAAETNNAVEAIVDRLPRQTSLVLTNAFYFKGDWLRPFDPTDTADGPFQTGAGSPVQVPMMSRAGVFPYARTEHGQVVRLFYIDPKLSLTLYLPDTDSDPSAARSESLAWLFTTDHTETTRPGEGTVSLPRLSLDRKMELTRLLSSLGMGALLGDSAAIQGIQGSIPPSVTNVVQRSVVEVTEQGTVAAAATAVIGLRTAGSEPFTFVADRPFHLALHHADVPTPLLVGYVSDPS